MDEEKKNNKRKLNTVSPTKGDQGARNNLNKESFSISSGGSSKMSTASSLENKDETMGNKGLDAAVIAYSSC